MYKEIKVSHELIKHTASTLWFLVTLNITGDL